MAIGRCLPNAHLSMGHILHNHNANVQCTIQEGNMLLHYALFTTHSLHSERHWIWMPQLWISFGKWCTLVAGGSDSIASNVIAIINSLQRHHVCIDELGKQSRTWQCMYATLMFVIVSSTHLMKCDTIMWQSMIDQQHGTLPLPRTL
jgi:hypothetical protein